VFYVSDTRRQPLDADARQRLAQALTTALDRRQ
jgi:hypothetical protein